MKKLEEIAENELEKKAIQDLINDMRKYTSESLSVLNFLKDQKRDRPLKTGLSNMENNLKLQKKVNDNLYELFQRMHRIIDFPSFIILEDELHKQYH